MDPQPTPAPLPLPVPKPPVVAALEGMIVGGTVPGGIVLALAWYLSTMMEQMEARIGETLVELRTDVRELSASVTDLRVETSRIPLIERDIQAIHGRLDAVERAQRPSR